MRPRETAEPDDPVAVRRKAMDLLARREYGRKELAERLARNGFNQDLILDVVAVLADEGLQSDQRMAEALVAARVRKGKGPANIRADLGRRGIDNAVTESALAGADIDWVALARIARETRFGTEAPADYAEFARQANFLKRRGFAEDQIRRAVDYDD